MATSFYFSGIMVATSFRFVCSVLNIWLFVCFGFSEGNMVVVYLILRNCQFCQMLYFCFIIFCFYYMLLILISLGWHVCVVSGSVRKHFGSIDFNIFLLLI